MRVVGAPGRKTFVYEGEDTIGRKLIRLREPVL